MAGPVIFIGSYRIPDGTIQLLGSAPQKVMERLAEDRFYQLVAHEHLVGFTR